MISLKSLNNMLLTAAAFIVLVLLNACSKDTAADSMEEAVANSDAVRYINLNIIVSNGNKNVTRAGEKPAAGENGDGREAAFVRENTITGITLILYQDANGINGDANTTLDLVKYFTVERTGTSLPANGTDLGKTKEVETRYTTGNQRLNKGEIDITKTYHAIVMANTDLCGKVSKLGDVRNYKINTLYSGNETMMAEECANFVMSSEADYTMNFATATPTAYEDGLLYSFENILIERMAARIDFWAAGSNGYKSTYTTPGYEYDVPESNDKFVVTGITPFNMNSGDATNGGEWLMKRLANEVSASPTITYLADETGSNFVLDPATIVKTDGTLTYFKNPLTSMGTLADVTTLSSNSYYKSVASLHEAVIATNSSAGFTNLAEGSVNGEDVIIAYPMENTLWESTVLYNCATGLAIEGDYYPNGTGTPVHRIFYGYLRHQGTASSYSAILGKDMSSSATTTATNCMEYGIVRNNIYRVRIDKINLVQGTIKIRIEEKHWRHVDNPVIYL